MKEKNNGGFSLVEVLLAMMILAAIVIPVCSGILLSVRMDARANDVLQARVAVSSAVETLMAQGITHPSKQYDVERNEETGENEDLFPDVEIKTALTLGELQQEETGTQETGTQETGTQETGTQETGTQETGTQETGTQETGTQETDAEEAGAPAYYFVKVTDSKQLVTVITKIRAVKDNQGGSQ